MAIVGFHHVAFSSPDLDRLERFYVSLFRFERVFDFVWEKGSEAIDRILGLEGSAGRAVMLRTGNSFIEIFEFSSPAPKRRDGDRPVHDHGLTHICIAVDDAAAECARLEKLGLRLHCPAVEMGPFTGTYGRDPDGNVIEILAVADNDFPLHFSNRRLAALRGA